MVRPFAVVAGCTGIVGHRIAQYLAEIKEWEVIGVSRKPPLRGAKFRSLQVDLTSAQDCKEKLRSLRGVTHLFYAARYDHDTTGSEPIDTNLCMLEHIVSVIEASTKTLSHIHIVHGTKYYGAPYGRYKTPSKEDDPRWVINNFYYAQQDFIVKRQEGKTWAWTISRPQAVSDYLPHIARSIPWGISVYASICKAQGLPLCFPGRQGNYSAIYQCTDAEHLAKAVVWMATDRDCANQTFNVTNGDYFRWENLWPQIAEYFRMPVGPVRHVTLSKAMADKSSWWNALTRKHELRKVQYDQLVVWPYLDFVLAPEYDRMSDLTKLRKFGFHDVVDTEGMFFKFFDFYRKNKMIPS